MRTHRCLFLPPRDLPHRDCAQRDETERISGEKTETGEAEGAAKKDAAASRVPEKEDTASVGAGEQTMSKVKQEAPSTKVRACRSVQPKAALRQVRVCAGHGHPTNPAWANNSVGCAWPSHCLNVTVYMACSMLMRALSAANECNAENCGAAGFP